MRLKTKWKCKAPVCNISKSGFRHILTKAGSQSMPMKVDYITLSTIELTADLHNR